MAKTWIIDTERERNGEGHSDVTRKWRHPHHSALDGCGLYVYSSTWKSSMPLSLTSLSPSPSPVPKPCYATVQRSIGSKTVCSKVDSLFLIIREVHCIYCLYTVQESKTQPDVLQNLQTSYTSLQTQTLVIRSERVSELRDYVDCKLYWTPYMLCLWAAFDTARDWRSLPRLKTFWNYVKVSN